MRTPQIFSDATGWRKWLVTTAAVLLALAAVVCGSAFLFSFLEIPIKAPVVGLFGAKAPPKNPAELFVSARRAPVNPALLERYRKDLRELERAGKSKHSTPPPAVGTPGKVAIGFFTTWQNSAMSSLRSNADKLTHVMPEWLHLKDDGSSFEVEESASPDTAQGGEFWQIAAKNGLQVWPIVNNYADDNFDAKRVHRLLASADAQRKFAAAMRDWLLAQHAQGLNLDFENLAAADYPKLADFTKLLGNVLHPAQLGLSLDLEIEQLKSKAMPGFVAGCDFIVLMAYDEHTDTSAPGPVASITWASNVFVDALKVIPPGKLVLGIGGFGYDWPKGSKTGRSITYQQAMLLARDNWSPGEAEQAIKLDGDSLNPRFEYWDAQGVDHTVWFLDGVTAFNQWALAQKANIAGAAVWMLGSEDPSVWQVLGKGALFQPLRAGALESIEFPYEIDFTGEGEILSVLAEPELGARTLTHDNASGLITNAQYTALPSCYLIQREGYHPKQLALTFDDGPSAEFTPAVLDTLHELGVPATFFILGENAARYPELIRRMWNEGHEIGNHSFSHPNLAEVSRQRAVMELTSTKRALQSILGRSTLWFRPPYNADAEPQTAEEVKPLLLGSELGFTMVGELIDPQDWSLWKSGPNGAPIRRTADDITRSVIDQLGLYKGNTILLHDAGGDRSATVAALRQMVPELKKRGYTFVRISDLAGISRDAAMPVLTARERVITAINGVVFGTIFGFIKFLGFAFVTAIFLGIARVFFVTTLALVAHFRARSPVVPPDFRPLVSVIVPGYNESKVVARTIQSVLANDWPNMEVIVVDDGSTDGMGDVVEREYGTHPKVRLLRQSNAGKAAALNNGITQSSGEIVVGLDADTQFATDTISSLTAHFVDPRVGAVAGNVKVGNVVNLLTRWQAVEYITSQNVDRLAYAQLNAVTVVPGAVGAWRRRALDEVGGYLTDTLAEDMDLTWRLRRKIWKIETEGRALAYTEAPAAVPQFFKQRFRWSFGTLQCLWKHRGALFHYGWFGWLGLPTMWLFQIIFQVLAPVVDLQILYALCASVSAWINQKMHGETDASALQVYPLALQTALFYALFYVVEMSGAMVAIWIDRERFSLLRGLFLQRFSYRQLMYAVLWKALVRAAVGTRTVWGKLERKGTVRVEAAG